MNTETKTQIDEILDSCSLQEHVFWDKERVARFSNYLSGCTLSGRAACADFAVGPKVAREDAENPLWKLGGYKLQKTLYRVEHVVNAV